MYRFLDININGLPVIEVGSEEEDLYAYKTAAYYLTKITQDMNDQEFMGWLNIRRESGFNDKDIEQLQGMYNHPQLKYCLSIMRFPLYCKMAVWDCIRLNDHEGKQQEGGHKKWL